jgi:hypothetical protein
VGDRARENDQRDRRHARCEQRRPERTAYGRELSSSSTRGTIVRVAVALLPFALPASVKVRLKASFESLRNAVINRFDAASPADRANHAQLLADYQAVTF